MFKAHSAHQVSTSLIVSMINANLVLWDARSVSLTQAFALNARVVIYSIRQVSSVSWKLNAREKMA